MKKIFSPRQHGLIDYSYGVMQLLIPRIIGLNHLAKLTYTFLGLQYIVVNLFSDTGAGMRNTIPLRTHRVLDILTIAGLAGLLATPMILKEKKAAWFHLAILAGTIAYTVLTDYDKSANG